MATLQLTPQTVEILKVSSQPAGIGKLVITSEAPWNIPHLHFNVYEVEEGFFCTNLELALDSFDTTFVKSVTGMAKLTVSHLNHTVQDDAGFDALISSVDHHLMDDLWRQYRASEFKLARHKKDIGSNMLSHYKKKIIKDLNNELKAQRSELETQPTLLFTLKDLSYDTATPESA